MDQRDTEILQLKSSLGVKDGQLKAAVALAGKAAEDLKKYRDLTIKMTGLRDILFHQRKAHAESCPNHAQGCQWDLGVLAFLASSMGITANNFAHKILKAMLVQYDAAIRKAQGKEVAPLGRAIDLIAAPSIEGSVPIIGRTKPATIGTQATLHVFKKKGPDDDRSVRPEATAEVPPAAEAEGAAAPVPEHGSADAQGSRPDDTETRRRSDEPGGAQEPK